MSKRYRVLASIGIFASMAMMLPASDTSYVAAEDGGDISYEVGQDSVTIRIGAMSVAFSKGFPAAAVKSNLADDDSTYGFVFSSILGYNESVGGGLVLEDVPYHASMEHSTWTMYEPVISEAGNSTTAYISMQSTVSMNKRIAFDGGNPIPGSPGTMIIENWATVTIRYAVSTASFFSTFEGAIGGDDYPVNGSTEVKFDVSIVINTPIDADHLALDIGLMKMHFGIFEPTAMEEQYLLKGFQEDEISISDPAINETYEDDLLLHSFHHRDQFKQLFTFVESREMGFFSWGSAAMSNASGGGVALEDIATYYRTDGEELKLYVSSPIDADTASVLHDPSIGLFPGGYVDLPDEEILGSSPLSTVLGAMAGLAVAGGVGILLVRRRMSRQDAETETIVLEKNRYYKGR